jgi:hypothetical protein
LDLATLIFDQDFKLLDRLYLKLLDLNQTITKEMRSTLGNSAEILNGQLLNVVAWGCGFFNQKQRMADVLFTAAVMDHRIDMQTYFKCQLNVLYSENEEGEEDLGDKTNSLLYFYLLFSNDCCSETDFKFGRAFIEEYLE